MMLSTIPPKSVGASPGYGAIPPPLGIGAQGGDLRLQLATDRLILRQLFAQAELRAIGDAAIMDLAALSRILHRVNHPVLAPSFCQSWIASTV